MELLLAGDLSVLTQQMYDALAAEFHLVLYGDIPADVERRKNARDIMAKWRKTETSLPELFRTYDFDRVVYFSSSLMRKPDWAAENHELHQLLELGVQYHVARSVFVALDVEQMLPPDNGNRADYEMLLREDTKRLCLFYAERLNLTVLRVPFLYDRAQVRYPLQQILQISHDSHRLCFRFGRETKENFLSMRDFLRLLLRVLDSSVGRLYTVCAAADTTLGEIGNALQSIRPGLTVVYDEPQIGLLLPRVEQKPDDGPRHDFGWSAEDMLLEDLSALYAGFGANVRPAKESAAQKLRRLVRQTNGSALSRGLAVTALFVILEAISRYTSANGELSFMDLRLLFVTVAASVYGLRPGLYAALLACAASAFSSLSSGMNWQILFYNLENWLPFAFYLILGAGLGYMRDRSQSKIRRALQAKKVVEEKYLFIKGIYEDMLESKRMLRQQLLISHESFGKIYEITRMLDKDTPDRILLETLSAIESTLDNHSAAIYTLAQNSAYGRLIVCSRALSTTLARSMRFDKYPSMMEHLREDEVWSNTEALPNYPEYCAPIYRDGVPIYLIVLYHARYEQMGTYYVNQIKILCGLAKSALLRAFVYQNFVEEKNFVKGTMFLNEEAFAKELDTRRAMAEQFDANYTLCGVVQGTRDLAELGRAVFGCMRVDDIAGICEGTPCILFQQMKSLDFPAVQRRFAAENVEIFLYKKGSKWK
jgi:UDP-glucose 4-epimerase